MNVHQEFNIICYINNVKLWKSLKFKTSPFRNKITYVVVGETSINLSE